LRRNAQSNVRTENHRKGFNNHICHDSSRYEMSLISPRVSVIIPTYNRAHLIDRAIQSVLAQTYQDFEVIVVDDGSTDNTEEVVLSFGSEKMLYIRHDKNRGVGAARNTGIRVARGEYIAFQDSDDEWYPNRLDEISGIMEDRKDIDFIFSYGKVIKNGDIIGDVGRAPWANDLSKEELVVRLFSGNFIALQAVVVKKEKILEVGGFDERLPSAEDYELWLRLLPICSVYFVDKPVYDLYFSQECITADITKVMKSQVRILIKNRNILKRHVRSRVHYYAVRQKYISNIFSLAAYDTANRKGRKRLAILLYLLSRMLYPYFFIAFTKRITGHIR